MLNRRREMSKMSDTLGCSIREDSSTASIGFGNRVDDEVSNMRVVVKSSRASRDGRGVSTFTLAKSGSAELTAARWNFFCKL